MSDHAAGALRASMLRRLPLAMTAVDARHHAARRLRALTQPWLIVYLPSNGGIRTASQAI